MKHLEATIDIKAEPEAVWRVLIDFSRYPEWNPFIIAMEGQAAAGEKLREVILQPDGKKVKLSSLVLTVEPAQRLEWRGHFLAPFLFSGRHACILEPLPEGTRFIQQEVFTGIALPLMNIQAVLPGYHQMNEALKARVESLAD